MTRLKKSAPKLRPDVAETAFRIMQEATGETPRTLPPSQRTEKNPEAVKRGRKGGKKGGKARAKSLPAGTRSTIAKDAACTRWQRGAESD